MRDCPETLDSIKEQEQKRFLSTESGNGLQELGKKVSKKESIEKEISKRKYRKEKGSD